MKSSIEIREELIKDEEIIKITKEIVDHWGVTQVFGIPPKIAVLEMMMSEISASLATSIEDFLNEEHHLKVLNGLDFKELVIAKLKEEQDRIHNDRTFQQINPI